MRPAQLALLVVCTVYRALVAGEQRIVGYTRWEDATRREARGLTELGGNVEVGKVGLDEMARWLPFSVFSREFGLTCLLRGDTNRPRDKRPAGGMLLRLLEPGTPKVLPEVRRCENRTFLQWSCWLQARVVNDAVHT